MPWKGRSRGGSGSLGFGKQGAETLVLSKRRWDRRCLLTCFFLILEIHLQMALWSCGTCSRLGVLGYSDSWRTLGHVSPQTLKWMKGMTVFMCIVGEEQWAVDMGIYLLSWLNVIMTISNPCSLGEGYPNLFRLRSSVTGSAGPPGDSRFCQERRCVAKTDGGLTDANVCWSQSLHITSRSTVTSCVLLDMALCSVSGFIPLSQLEK